MNLGRGFFYGEKGDWSWGYFRNLTTAFLTFKGTGAVAASASQWATKTRQISGVGFFGRTFLDFTKTAAPNLGIYGGIVLADGAQQGLGWKIAEVGANLWFDSALFFVELRMGGVLSRHLFSGAEAVRETWRRAFELKRAEGIFSSQLPKGEVALTETGMQVAIPDRSASRSEASVPPRARGQTFAAKRAWILKARQSLNQDPAKRPDLWSNFRGKLTRREAEVLDILLQSPDAATQRELEFQSGIPSQSFSNHVAEMIRKLEGFAPKPQPNGGVLSAMRGEVLAARRELEAKGESAKLWEIFTGRLSPQRAKILRSLFEHPKIQTVKAFAELLGVSSSVVYRELNQLMRGMREFLRAPGQPRAKPRPGRPKSPKYLMKKREWIEKIRKSLQDDPVARERLWSLFRGQLTQREREFLDVLLQAYETTTLEDASLQLGVSSGSSANGFGNIMKRLEAFAQKLPAVSERPSNLRKEKVMLAEVRNRIVAARRELEAANPHMEAKAWQYYKDSLAPSVAKTLNLLFERPEIETIRPLAELLGISVQLVHSHLHRLELQLEKFLRWP